MAATLLAQAQQDFASFYKGNRDPQLVSNLEKAGNSPANDLFFSSSLQRTNALANLLAIGGGAVLSGSASGRIFILEEGQSLRAGNVVEIAKSEQPGHQYKMRVLENAGTAARDVISWVHVRHDSTVNGHTPNFDYALKETLSSARQAATKLKS